LQIRNQQMRAKMLTAEMTLAHARNELVSKALVTKHASFLLVAMRQQLLNLPQTYARGIVGLKDASQAKKMLQEMAISVLFEPLAARKLYRASPPATDRITKRRYRQTKKRESCNVGSALFGYINKGGYQPSLILRNVWLGTQ